MDYEKLLEKAKKEMPKAALEKERFEIPKIRGHLQGNRTIVSNFVQIAGILRRNIDHMLKYVLKELATPGEIKKSGSLILGTKVSASRLNEKIKKYAEEFVLCNDCGKPDTKLEREGEFMYLKCMACGAKHYVKSRI